MSPVTSIMKTRRKELGLTLAQIADALGVTEATVQRWESGNIKTLRYERIVALSSVLRIPPEKLMGWVDTNDQRTTAPAPISELEEELLTRYRKADKKIKEIINFALDIET